RQGAENLEPRPRVSNGESFSRGLRHRRCRSARQQRAAERREISDKPLLLLELVADRRTTCRGSDGLIVVAGHGRRSPSVEERPGALVKSGSGGGRITRLTRASKEHLLDVALRQRSLPTDHFDDRGAV